MVGCCDFVLVRRAKSPPRAVLIEFHLLSRAIGGVAERVSRATLVVGVSETVKMSENIIEQQRRLHEECEILERAAIDQILKLQENANTQTVCPRHLEARRNAAVFP